MTQPTPQPQNKLEKIEEQIEKLTKLKSEILAKQEAEKNKLKTIKVKFNNKILEVETQIHHKEEMFKEIIIPKGWRLLKVEEIIFLFNNYAEELNLKDTWEFIEQPFKLNKDNDYVARFLAGSDGANLYCYWDAGNRGAGLGVRFVREVNK